MSLDYTKVQMTSQASSNKVLQEDNSTFTVPALPGIGDTFGIATIPITHTDNRVIAQVWTDESVLPWSSNDSRRRQYYYIEGNNLNIVCISSDTSGLGSPSFNVSYAYRILLP